MAEKLLNPKSEIALHPPIMGRNMGIKGASPLIAWDYPILPFNAMERGVMEQKA